jgi:hypothetical protein
VDLRLARPQRRFLDTPSLARGVAVAEPLQEQRHQAARQPVHKDAARQQGCHLREPQLTELHVVLPHPPVVAPWRR